MDESLILTADVLSLSPDLTKGKPLNGIFVVKNVKTQTYLAVDDQQWKVLNEFAHEHAVPDVLETAIRARTCPALSEYYELILKACRAFVLRSDLAVPVRRTAVRWFVPLSSRFMLPLSVILTIAGWGAIMRMHGALSVAWPDLALGWVIVCSALSAGYAAAACILRAGGCEVYHPRLRWRTPVPHFTVDLSDGCMAERPLRLAAELAIVAPLAAVVAGALLANKTWSLVPLIALLLVQHPFAGGPIAKLLLLFRRRPILDTDHDFLFHQNRRPAAGLRATWKIFEWRTAAMRIAYGIAWIWLLAHVFYRAWGLSLQDVLTDKIYWQKVVVWLAGAILATVLIELAWLFWGPIWAGERMLRQRGQRFWRRWRHGAEVQANPAAIQRLVRESPLLRRLKPDVQAEFVRELKPFAARAWRTILSFDEAPGQVGLIISGRATVYRRTKSGRRVPYMRLVEGDMFGVQGMVDSNHPRLEVRAKTPLHALVLPAEVFQRLVIDKLGPLEVFNLAHKHVILQRSELCQEWRPQAISRFTQIADVVSYAPGDKIIREGAETKAFYLVSEGEVTVLNGCRRIARVKPGGFLGEIGLLQNSVSTADVEAGEDTRCLVVDKNEFMRFMSHNYHVALQLERVSSRRLGHPIFPLNPLSFEDR
jgi:CRP-like cAMP-binding protein